MKNIQVRYSSQFLRSPMSDWVGVPYYFWVKGRTPSGQKRKLRSLPHPFYVKYNVYAQLVAHLDGINLVFATPQELDHFVEIMSMNPLPRGRRFYPKRVSPGLPNTHWLSRFPAKGKSWKFRQKAIKFLTAPKPAIQEFRHFYANKSLDEVGDLFGGRSFEGSGYHDDPYRPLA